ncbi:MAG: pantoate--beta-alanine ligase [Chloroflexi bacterium 13_1_40CM_4_68_4]|nr:MAG: pantoate--beta-alanine ligase [Chloroflexi bacterium 13_1_40CM_4_68_4]
MKVLRTAREVRAWRADAGRVGFVPTMGALHAGHISLMERAVREADAPIASIFVNPTQFAPHEDYAKYPRREDDDVAMLEAAGVAAAFVPSALEMYPAGAKASLDPGPIAEPLEGRVRPGHFAGVVTVVERLFTIVQPDIALFGQKDFQQLRVIQVVLGPRHPKLRIVGCPIVREADGLAMSSRNAYLSADERRRALVLSRGLFAARDLWAGGTREAERLTNAVRRHVDAPGVSLEYVSAADPITLAELRGRADRAVVSLAARVGRARLIDNVLLGMDVNELS